MGFDPSELFPPDEAVSPLDDRNPHAVATQPPPRRPSPWPIVAAPAQRVGVPRREPPRPQSHLSTSGPGTSPESVARSPGLTNNRTRCSLGVPSSPGPRTVRTGDIGPKAAFLLPWASPRRPCAACKQMAPRRHAGPPECCSIRWWAAGSHPLPTLMRSSNLVSPLGSLGSAAALAHVFASGSEPRHRALTTHLRTASRPLPEIGRAHV